MIPNWHKDHQANRLVIKRSFVEFLCFLYGAFVVTGNVVAASTISSPWTPVAGPPADTNGTVPDSKNLDVGDVSDVSVLNSTPSPF